MTRVRKRLILINGRPVFETVVEVVRDRFEGARLRRALGLDLPIGATGTASVTDDGRIVNVRPNGANGKPVIDADATPKADTRALSTRKGEG